MLHQLIQSHLPLSNVVTCSWRLCCAFITITVSFICTWSVFIMEENKSKQGMESHDRKMTRKQNRCTRYINKETGITFPNEPRKALLVGNAGLVSGLQREQVLEVFMTYGLVTKVVMLPGKSYCFVEYNDLASAEKAFRTLHGKVNLPTLSGVMYLAYADGVPASSDEWSVPLPPGLLVLPNFINEEDEEHLLSVFEAFKEESSPKMQTMLPCYSDISSSYLSHTDGYQFNDYSHFSFTGSHIEQLTFSAPLAGADAANDHSLCDMDTWALESQAQPSQEDNNNNNDYSVLEQSLSQTFKYEEVSLSDFSLDDSNHQAPSEPPKPPKRLGRPPGRRSKRTNGKEKPPGRLWKFILKCLEDPNCNPTIITWVDKTRGMFRFVQSDKVAQRWGDVKGNRNMTYEKMSRALRYYKSGAFAPISQRLVYAFGKNVPWNSDNDRRVMCSR